MTIISREDLPVTVSTGELELRMCEVGNMTLTFYRVPKGTDWGSLIKGLPEDMCHCPHWGYFFKGKLAVQTKTGIEIVDAGKAFYTEPGHIPEFLEDCEFIEFSPTIEYKQVMEHMMRQAASTTE